jgi:hypothetical protein
LGAAAAVLEPSWLRERVLLDAKEALSAYST